MKSSFLVVVAGLACSQAAWAGGVFSCEVLKRVTYRYECVRCVEFDDEHECRKDVNDWCLGNRLVETGIADSARDPGTRVLLSGRGREAEFSFSLDVSGYTMAVSSGLHRARAEFQNPVPLDPSRHEVELIAPTGQQPDRPGVTTELRLRCHAH